MSDITKARDAYASKNLSKIDRNFMMSDETLELVLQAITKLENKVDTKIEIDKLWSEVKNIILAEMQKLPDLPRSNFKKQQAELGVPHSKSKLSGQDQNVL